MVLSVAEARVLGCLVEKQLSTPQQYPLTLNALVLGCNQSSNRHPVLTLTEPECQDALSRLKEERLVRFVLPSHGRSVVRYRHVLDESWSLDPPQLAVLASLLLRGPQTVAELRTRTERMVGFDGHRRGRAHPRAPGRPGGPAGRRPPPAARPEGGPVGPALDPRRRARLAGYRPGAGTARGPVGRSAGRDRRPAAPARRPPVGGRGPAGQPRRLIPVPGRLTGRR